MSASGPYDLCIVGAGLAGGLIAAQLTRQGRRIALLEAGSRFDFGQRLTLMRRHQTLGGERWPWAREDRDRYVDASADTIGQPYPLNDYRLKGVGGSTLHWQGRINRLMPSDFVTASATGLGVDWPFGYDHLEPFYTQADWEMGVSGVFHPSMPPRSRGFPMDGFPPSSDDRVWQPVAQRLGIEVFATPWAINSRPYNGRSQCLAYADCHICPSGARYSADFHVGLAERSGLCDLSTETVARRIDLDGSGKVKAIHATRLDGRDVEISARCYVIAAHAIESARLLLLSRCGNDSDQVGRNLMEHAYLAAGGYLPGGRFRPNRVGFEVLESLSYYRAARRGERGGIKLEFTFNHDPLRDMEADRLWGRRLAQHDRERFGRWLGIEAETEMQPKPDSRVTLDESVRDLFGDPVPHIRLTFDAVERRTQAAAREILAHLLHEMGIAESQRTAPSAGWGAHHMGTCRMADDPAKGVVDRDCRVHGSENLFVVGGSVLPTTGAVQPSLTVAALSLRLARHLHQVLG